MSKYTSFLSHSFLGLIELSLLYIIAPNQDRTRRSIIKLFLIGNANPFLPGAGFLCWDLSLASLGNEVPGSHDIERAWEPFYTESISNMQINNDGGV